MVLVQATRATARLAARKVATQQQKRTMAGGGGPKPEWEGIDKIVRGYFPEDYQLAGAVLTGYTVLISAAVLRSKLKGKAPEPEAKATTVAVAGGDLPPALDSADFEAFLGSEERLAKFVESEVNMMKWIDTLGNE